MMPTGHRFLRVAASTSLALVLLSVGCKEEWDDTQHPLRDAELESAFFSGLNAEEIPDVPEPRRLRPCCVFGNDVAVSVGSIPVPGYEVHNVLDVSELGTHTDDEFGPGTGAPAARVGENSRLRG
jgi:hypothetical protein